ncbi:outer membrane beta-barrel protein [Paraflavitalea sp. CAU 1676]|uniref:outer membrane beta-barrel protein n=1 Tax=Paraflavitalea sp. CAU 1676 TaxID=3032598 RepID=UPI0023DBAA42|nr:outer membrane beta-barrel protein [Paraflavitalea sp. CAU 1676]MDF2192195.1 outer membrane beta-barrel protein [Paraflavitalea sp. CAU 1676]
MLRKISVLAIGVACSTCALAQDSTKKSNFSLTGSADVYYRYGFNNYKESPYNNKTSFTNSHNSFELGMATIKAEHSIGKVGMVADIGFGKRAQEFSYNEQASADDKSTVLIKQLYLTYAVSDKVKFTVGSWGTHVGYEVLDAYLNRNYSMSYLFSYGPFFHTGVKADISLGGTSAFMVGITNPTDFKSASAAPKMFIGQFSTGTKDGKLKAFFNYQGGKYTDEARLNQYDVVATYAATDKFSLGVNGSLQSRSAKGGDGKWGDSESWKGAALYLNYDPATWAGLTLRTEYFDNKKNVLGVDGLGTSFVVPTISANFRIDNLTIIPEFRFDNAKDDVDGTGTPVFYKKDGAATKSSGSFLLALTYHF